MNNFGYFTNFTEEDSRKKIEELIDDMVESNDNEVPYPCSVCDIYNYGFGASYCEECVGGPHKFLKGDD